MRKRKAELYTALITPFLDDGSIDWQAYEHLLLAQAKAKVSGVVISGTTGEASTLQIQEKISLFRKAKALLGAHGVTVMAGVGGQDTSSTYELAKLAIAAGVDSLLVVTPPYNKPNTSGLIAHYQKLATLKIPLCLYHVPARTGQRLSIAQLKKLAEIKEISLLKEASGDLTFFSQSVEVAPWVVYSGDDGTYLPSLAVGASGCISVLSNIFPKAFVKMGEAFYCGQVDRAYSIHKALFDFIQLLFIETNPVPIKAILAHTEQCKEVYRLPLAPMETINKDLLVAAYTRCRSVLIELEDVL